MAITTQPPEALALAQKLCKRLDARAPQVEKAERYYDGRHNLRFATRKFREAFGALFREFADNYCGLVVDSTSERLRIEGFRLPTKKSEEAAEKAQKEAAELARTEREAQKAVAAAAVPTPGAPGIGQPAPPAADDSGTPPAAHLVPAPVVPPTSLAKTPSEIPIESGIGIGVNTGDDEAWKIWQKNNLDLYSDLAHETALITGFAFIMVGPQDDGSTDDPIITVEHPLEVYTQHAAGNTKIITAAIKRWHDNETGHAYLTLYLPDSIWRYESKQATKGVTSSRLRWIPRQEVDLAIENPFDGIVPVVPLINRQKLDGQGRSELIDIIPLQDGINKLNNDMLVASEFAAFRQRILTGMEIPEDENGNIVPDFDLKAAIDRIMVVKDENVGVHEFQISDLSQYVKAIEQLRNDIAAISRTPPQYLVGDVVNSSAEALKAAESGLVKKVQKRQRFFGESWEEAIRLAFLLKGDTERADSYNAETIWANPEVMTEAALADSLSKYAILGVPLVALWEKLGASQTEIQRWLQLKQEEPSMPQGWPAALGALVKTAEKDVE